MSAEERLVLNNEEITKTVEYLKDVVNKRNELMRLYFKDKFPKIDTSIIDNNQLHYIDLTGDTFRVHSSIMKVDDNHFNTFLIDGNYTSSNIPSYDACVIYDELKNHKSDKFSKDYIVIECESVTYRHIKTYYIVDVKNIDSISIYIKTFHMLNH
jgi:hypothetical protein